MTVPGDSTTGSTFLNDLRGGFEWVVWHGAITLYAAAIIVPLVIIAVVLVKELRKNR